MEDRSVSNPQVCVGIDLGDRYSHMCFLDRRTGEVLEESRLRTSSEALAGRFRGMERARVAVEVGSNSPWVSRLLEEAGHEVLVANSRKLRLIYENDSKCDRVDAEQLARLAAADPKLLHPIRHREAKTQADRAALVARDQLVGCRTKLVNCVRGMAKSLGKRLPRCGATVFHNKIRSAVPEELRDVMTPLLDALAFLHKKITDLDKQIETLCSRDYPETARLMQPKGIGPITALNYVLTVEDPGRFERSRSLGSYFGLRPKKSESSGRNPELRITKAGDRMMRRHLVQAAQYILGPFGEDCDLRRWGLALAGRGAKNAKKRAVVAVARKLAVLLHRLWITGEAYEPLRNHNRKMSEAMVTAT